MNHTATPPPPVLPPPLDSLLTRIRQLQSRPARTAQNAFFVEGLRHFIQACDARFHFEAIIYSPILLKGDLANMLVRRLHQAGVPRLRVSPEAFRAISVTDRASGIGAIVRQRWMPLEHADVRRGIGFLVVEFVRSPGNLGTILRTAEATGASGVICLSPPACPGVPAADPFHPAAVRASMGGLFHVPLIRATRTQLARWRQRHEVMLAALSADAPRLWTDLPFARGHPLAFAVGEERQGLSPELRALCTTAVRLPMTGRADSLNVSIAAGVMLYEMMRRQSVGASPLPWGGAMLDQQKEHA